MRKHWSEFAANTNEKLTNRQIKDMLSVSPSKQMVKLLKERPHLLNNKNAPLCLNVEQNFLRALMIKKFFPLFEKFFTNKAGVVPNAVEIPYHIRKDFSFIVRFDSEEIIKAGTVLYRESIGTTRTAVILDGPYAGLIIELMRDRRDGRTNIGVANRLWREKQVYPGSSFYNIWINDIRMAIGMQDFFNFLDETRNFLNATYTNWLENENLTESTTLLGKLLKEQGIKFNPKKLHRVKPENPIKPEQR